MAKQVKCTSADRRKIMGLSHNIRNISVIGHVGHGKSTLTDSLVAAAAGIIPGEEAGHGHMTDTRADEVERRMSIKSTGISLCYQMTDGALKDFTEERNGNEFLINLIDTPGHVDFSAEVTAALRITDGALVVVDCAEGVCLQTRKTLRQALNEQVRPVLVVNMIDRCFFSPLVDGETAYQLFNKIIQDTNKYITSCMYGYIDFDHLLVSPENGSVIFSSGLHGWGFNLSAFADMWVSTGKVSNKLKFVNRLWGENYYDPETKKWTTTNTGSPSCKRGFVGYCYESIKQIIDASMNVDKTQFLWDALSKLEVTIDDEEKHFSGEALRERVMQKWLPFVTPVLKAMIYYLPSPKNAQQYRVNILYRDGLLEDKYSEAIKSCDPDGPLMLYVSKMIPAPEKGVFFAFGRVFAGRISSGLNVRIMGPNYVYGGTKDLYFANVKGTLICMGKKEESIEDVPCGNTVALSFSLNSLIPRCATLTNEKEDGAHPIRQMYFTVSPVVRKAVSCKADFKKLVSGLKCLAKSDPLVVCTSEDSESGEAIISCAGELHMEICLKDLQDDFMDGVVVKKSEPFAAIYETVLENKSPKVKTEFANGHLLVKARPLDASLVFAIENGRVGPSSDPVARGDILSKEFGLHKYVGKEIWCFGPGTNGSNMVVDMRKSKELQNMTEIRKNVISGFEEAIKKGCLAGETMIGISFEVHDARLDADPAHLDDNDIFETAKKAILSAQEAAQPRFMQPFYVVEFQAREKDIENIRNLIRRRHGNLEEATKRKRPLTELVYDIWAYMPVTESFGFYEELKKATSEDIKPQSMFAFWELVRSDPRNDESLASKLLSQIQKRKGLKEQTTPV